MSCQASGGLPYAGEDTLCFKSYDIFKSFEPLFSGASKRFFFCAYQGFQAVHHSQEFDAASHTWPLTSLASRAEDIPCLRKSSFVMRQQALPERSPVSETQEEKMSKLVKMAALQINTSKATRANGGLAGKTPELK
eukprot:g13030.t1